MQLIADFFRDIDRAWGTPAGEKIRLHVIGSAALMLQTAYQRGTKDSDVLETAELADPTKKRLLQLAGPASQLAARHRLYLEFVSSGTPFLPQVPAYLTTDVNALLQNFEILALDVVDVVVSKLKRLSANDRSDIEAMATQDLVPHDRLVARFRAAVDYHAGDARAEDLPRYVANLHTIERDVLGADETEIELPEWLDR